MGNIGFVDIFSDLGHATATVERHLMALYEVMAPSAEPIPQTT
jgi:hypothetical protein